jgi:hypothetical protein
MAHDTHFRHAQALDPSGLDTIAACLHAIQAAAKDCRNAGLPFESDPAVVQGRDFLLARVESRRRATMPVGTLVVFAGGRHSFTTNAEASAFGTNVFATLDKVREHVADMVLVHGGDSKGVDRLAASWAEQRKIPQIALGLETRLGARAGFRRNEQMLSLNPRYLVAFAGNGVLERLVIDAKAKRISVVDRRGPLGTNPKLNARQLETA